MAETRFKIDLKVFEKLRKKLKDVRQPADKSTAVRVGKSVVKAMRDTTASGNSPIRGKGKFPPYKDPSKYPGKRKGKTPVNLRLTGAFMKSLRFTTKKVKLGIQTSIGFSSKKSRDKEDGHREGVNKQPKRPIIPSVGRGERFSEKIQRIVNRIYQERVRQITKKR
jgi:hypothetical protein